MKQLSSITFSLLIFLIFVSASLAQVTISGTLGGILEDTTYFVVGDVWVSPGDSLTIEAGAELIFWDGVLFDIDGFIHAAGTETDSIKFINIPGFTRGRIDFNSSSDDSSRLEYCLITVGYEFGIYPESCGGGILCYLSSPSISNCTISGNSAENKGGGILCYLSSPSISNCTISGNSAEGEGGGICCTGNSSPEISNCTISGNSTSDDGGGILCKDTSSPAITNCNISENSTLYDGGGIFCYLYSGPSISNCTISGNTAEYDGGGIYSSYNSTIDMLNTIVEGNNGDYGIYFEGSSGSNSSIIYSDFYNNEGGNFYNPPAGVGTIITVNANGDPCDQYLNIFLDPLFYSTFGDSAYYLTAHSPCIDAGDPESPLDPDSTIADIGAHYYDQSPPKIEDLTITVNGNDIILNWTEIPEASSYNIYRSDEPYFDIFGMTPIANVSETQYVDESILSEGPYFYIVTYEY